MLNALMARAHVLPVSTVDPMTTLRIADAIKAAGGRFLEAPVSGSKGPAEQGQLVFLSAGDEELFESVQHPLEVRFVVHFSSRIECLVADAKQTLIVFVLLLCRLWARHPSTSEKLEREPK